MSALAAAWAFLKTGAGKALAVIAALAAALLYAFLRGHRKGAQAQASKDAAVVQDAHQRAANATTQQDVYQSAHEAAAAVPQAKAPDTSRRDDFNNTGFPS